MIQDKYTDEELKLLKEKLASSIDTSPPKSYIGPAPVKYYLIGYDRALFEFVHNMVWSPVYGYHLTWGKRPDSASVLMEDLNQIPLKVNDWDAVVRVIAAWRLEIAK